MGSLLKVVSGWGAEAVEAAMKVGVGGVRFGQLIFKDDDAARRVECGALVDEFTDPGCDAQLVAGVAAVTAFGALRCE